MKDYFEQNIKALIQQNPYLGSKLFGMKELENFDIYVDEKDLANINLIDKRNFIPIYQTKPIDETIEKIKEFDKFSRYPFLYFFGIGNGIFFKLLLNNEQHKRIIIVEPEIEILYTALHFSDLAKYIESGRLIILSEEEVTFTSMQTFFQHEEKIYLKAYHLDTISNFYLQDQYTESMIRVNKCILDAINHCILGLGNDSTDALLGIEQHVTNIERMVTTPTAIEFVRNAKNTDLAIIVSTGPSLKKQLPLLQKIKEHVTIVSVDASFPILAKHDIKPDIVVSIERIPNTAKFFINTPKEYHEDVIFALTSIQDKAVLNSTKAGTQQISMRPFGYTRYFDFDEWGYMGIGMSAANFAYEIVYQSKFKRVILIGQDLAYADDGKSHSEGHTFGSDERSYRLDDSKVTAYGGEGTVRTSMIWNLFKRYFEVDIANSKDTLEAINSTEGGARIEGSIEMPFAEAIDKYVDYNHTKSPIKLKSPTKEEISANILKTRNKVSSMLEYAVKIKNEVSELFKNITKEIEHFDKIEARKNLNDVNYDDVFELIKELDRIKEYFNDKEFALVFADATQAFIFHQEINIATIQIRDSNTEKEKKLKMLDWLYAHQYWLFSLAGSMQAMIDVILYGIDETISKEFLKDIIKKYSDISDYEEFMFNKYKFFLKKRLWSGPDSAPQIRLVYMLNLLSEYYSYDNLNKIIKNDFIIKNDNLINVSRSDELLSSRNKLMDILGPLQKDIIKQKLSTNKKNVVLFIQETILVDEDAYTADVDCWMREEYESIIKLFDENEFNIILAVNRPLDSNNIKDLSYLDVNSINEVDEHILSFDAKHKPFMLGWDLITQLDFVDMIVSLDDLDTSINYTKGKKYSYVLEKSGSWRYTTELKDNKDIIYPKNVPIIRVLKENYKDIISKALNQ
jgi:hypothetical protein